MSKILLVEDDPDMSLEIKILLESNRMTVDRVSTIRKARDFVGVSSYDLLILDWNLPDGEGVHLLQEVRSRGDSVPILMLTSRKHIEDKKICFSTGTDDFLEKPFHPVELVCRVQALLRRVPIRLSNELKISDLVLNLETRCLTKAGREINLPPKEFALLEFFLRNPNQVFSAECLLERIWKTDNESTPHTVVNTIHRLRKKIDSPGAPPIIKNQFGTGYTLQLTD